MSLGLGAKAWIGELVLLVGMVGTEVNVGDCGTVILGETENCWI